MYELTDKEALFIYTGPDGSGRKTLAKMVASAFDMATVPSYTTRPAGRYETDGEDYHFVSEDVYLQLEAAGEFIESVWMDGFYYGIRERDIIQCFKEHKIVYLTLNAEGAQALKDLFGEKAIRIFVYADKETVVERQMERGDEHEAIERHMSHYTETMQYRRLCEHMFENYDLPQVAFQISEVVEDYLDRGLFVTDY